MRKVLALVLLALLFEPDAQAQPSAAPTSGRPPVFVQSCYAVFTIYGFLPVCTATPVDPDELDRRVTNYLTNGAGVMAAPSAGPAAAYFHDASKVLAAPTTSWIPTFPPTATASPSVTPAPSAVAPMVDAAAPAPVQSPSTENPAAQTEPAGSTASWVVDETPSALPSATLPGPTGEPTGAAATKRAAAAPAPAPAPSSPPPAAPTVATLDATAGPTPSIRVVQPWWGAVFAGVVVGAGALFLVGSRIGVRIGRRLRTVRARGA
jgi:hypothetical protein